MQITLSCTGYSTRKILIYIYSLEVVMKAECRYKLDYKWPRYMSERVCVCVQLLRTTKKFRLTGVCVGWGRYLWGLASPTSRDACCYTYSIRYPGTWLGENDDHTASIYVCVQLYIHVYRCVYVWRVCIYVCIYMYLCVLAAHLLLRDKIQSGPSKTG